ncbi:UNVERIFIED_CONTAM: hypothetical protein RMT77_009034 [Armadillidium vulgare]
MYNYPLLYILFGIICNISLAIVISDEMSTPPWATYDSCPVLFRKADKRPIFAMCDPGKQIWKNTTETETGILENHVKKCMHYLQEKNINLNSTVTLLFIFRNIIAEGLPKSNLSHLHIIMNRIEKWFNLTSLPAFVVLINFGKFEVIEWYSKGLKDIMVNDPPSEKDEDRRKLYGYELKSREPRVVLPLSLDEMCNVVERLFITSPFNYTPILWAILIAMLTFLFIGCGWWVYRFNRAHPTEGFDNKEMTDRFEMTQMIQDGRDEPMKSYQVKSDFFLLGGEFEPTTHEPARPLNNESVAHL